MTSARVDSDASACPESGQSKKRDGIGRKMLDCLLEFVRQLRHRDSARRRVGSSFALKSLSFRRAVNRFFCFEALLNLLASEFDACEVGSARGIAVEAFPGLLKKMDLCSYHHSFAYVCRRALTEWRAKTVCKSSFEELKTPVSYW